MSWDILYSWPPWAVGAVLVAVFVGAAELGFIGHRSFGRGGAKSETNDEGQVLSTALLLLALLLGFTFSMALGRYDERRAQVVQEADDIGTAWLRAGLLHSDAGLALQLRLTAYAKTRIGHADETTDAADYAAAKMRGGTLRHEIWDLTAAATAPIATTAQAVALVSAVNAVLDTATVRETAIETRVPEFVLDLLIAYAAVSAFLFGYVMGAYGVHHRVASTLLFALLAMTIMLIIDLDRPQSGGIRVSQQPIIDLVADLAVAPAPGPPPR